MTMDIICLATYDLLVMTDFLDGRPEFVEASSRGSGLDSISGSEGILKFRVEAKHSIESQRRRRKEVGDEKRYSSKEDRTNSRIF